MWPEPYTALTASQDAASTEYGNTANSLRMTNKAFEKEEIESMPSGSLALHQQRTTEFICKRCQSALPSADALQNHQDWHFAKDLQDEDYGQPLRINRPRAVSSRKNAAHNSRQRRARQGKAEKGQSKLAFG
jgi:DNA polymerase eta